MSLLRSCTIGPCALGMMLVWGACGRVVRCGTCGMRVDPSSPWVSYLTDNAREMAFDTPHCALAAWKKSTLVSGARFREYYSQQLMPADRVRFVVGSDVVGPMGAEFVPVGVDHAGRFARDHNGAPPKSAEQALEAGAP
jgi:hypothetical protein